MEKRSRRSRLHIVHEPDKGVAGTVDDQTAGSTGQTSPDDPAAKAARDLATAQTKLDDAQGAVRVAATRLDEAIVAAPKVHPVLAAAQQRVREAQIRAGKAADEVGAAGRALEDREAEARAAAALLEDAESNSKTTPGQLVVAQVRVEKADRAVIAARDALVSAQELAADADSALGESEQEVSDALQRPVGDHSSVVAAREKLSAAERAVSAAAAQVDVAKSVHQQQVMLAQSGQGAGAPVAPVFASVDVFVERYVVPNWCHRKGRDVRWCTQWWAHAEAVTRLEACWEAFEVMRREPAPSLSTFLRDHFDYHLRTLTATDGVFHACSINPDDGLVHAADTQWPTDPAPEQQFHRDPAARVQPRPSHNEVTA